MGIAAMVAGASMQLQVATKSVQVPKKTVRRIDWEKVQKINGWKFLVDYLPTKWPEGSGCSGRLPSNLLPGAHWYCVVIAHLRGKIHARKMFRHGRGNYLVTINTLEEQAALFKPGFFEQFYVVADKSVALPD